jgi:hypothetical protein
MSHYLIPTLSLPWLAILAGAWLGWQLVRQMAGCCFAGSWSQYESKS